MTASVPRTLAPLLRNALPDADLERSSPLGEGWNVTAWRLPDPSGDWVVRVPKLEWAAGEIERQTCLYPRLLALGLPVVRDAQVVRDGAGRVACGLYRYIEGEPARLTPGGRARREHLARIVGGFLTALHAVPLEVVRGCKIPEVDAWPDRYRPVLEESRPHLSPASLAWVEAACERLALTYESTPPRVLLHGDLFPEHLLLDEQGEFAGVIDWSGPQIADPAVDFGRLVQHFDTRFAEQVLSHYGGSVDGHFTERMRLYASLQAVVTVHAGYQRGLPEWFEVGKRQVAARAAAATRAAR